MDSPEGITTKDLAVITGIATNKIGRFERWVHADSGRADGAVEKCRSS